MLSRHLLKATVAAAALLLAPNLARADSTVSAMTAASALTGPELFYCVQTAADHNCTATQLKTFVTSSGVVTSVGFSVPATSIFTATGSPVTGAGTLGFTTAGTSGGIPYFSSAAALSSSAVLTANLPVIGGGAGVAPTVGTVSGNTTKFATVNTTTFATGQCVQVDASLNLTTTGSACGAGGGIVFPQTVSGTTTSGGIPYFSAATTLSSSAVLTANLPVIGGGAGVAPSVGSVSGNTTKFATVNTTTFATGQCVQVDASLNLTTTGSACGAGGGGTPGGANTNVQYNNSGAFGGSSSFTWNNAATTLSIGTGELDAGDIVAAIGIITSSTPNVFSQTWSNSATTFTGFRTNITNTASASASKLFDFQVGGASYMYASTDGAVTIAQQTAAISSYAFVVSQQGNTLLQVGTSTIQLFLGSTTGTMSLANFANSINWGGGATLISDAAFILSERNGASAQTFRVYNTADAAVGNPTNYERAVLDWTTTGNTLIIGQQFSGTGQARQVNIAAPLHLGYTSGTPTANSCAGFALTTGSSDVAGKVTFTSATSCSITFANAFTNAPFCVVSPGSAASTHDAVTSTTGLAVTFGTANTSMQWHCFGS